MNILSRYHPYFFFVYLLTLFSVSHAHAQELVIGPTPDWVVERELSASFAEQAQVGMYDVKYLLEDTQISYLGSRMAGYKRLVRGAGAREALESVSRINFGYEASFQSYQIHYVKIWRDGEVIDVTNKLNSIFTSGYSRSFDDEYDGNIYVELLVPGVRQGDIVDLAYTIFGQNTAFGDHAIGWFVASTWQEKSYNHYQRIILPKNRKIFLSRYGGLEAPSISETAEAVEYEWYWPELAKSKFERSTPPGVIQAPTLFYSDFSDWKSVKEWAQALFDGQKDSAQISALAKKLTKGLKGDRKKVEAIARFLQSEIRYDGSQIARNGYIPFPPEVVLDRRYGDCKDQSVLMQKMLKAIGIEGQLALVNSEGEAPLEITGVSPLAFDHLIVKVKAGGRIIWVDPTEPLARTSPIDLYSFHYGKALVLDSFDGGLEKLPKQVDVSPDYRTVDEIHFENGLLGKVTWQTITNMSHLTANDLRLQLELGSLDKLTSDLLKLKESDYSDISSVGTIALQELRERFELTESYILPEVSDKAKDRMYFEFRPSKISSALGSGFGKVEIRKLPYMLSYPLNRAAVIKIKGGTDHFWEFESEISTPYHYYSQQGEFVGEGDFQITYQYKTLAEEVRPEDLAAFADETRRIRDELLVRLWRNKEDPSNEVFAYLPVAESSNPVKAALEDFQQKTTFLSFSQTMMTSEDRGNLEGIYSIPHLPRDVKRRYSGFLGFAYAGSQQYEEALFWIDKFEEMDGEPDHMTAFAKALSLQGTRRYQETIDVVKEAIDKSIPFQITNNEKGWYDLLRNMQWRVRDYAGLKDTLAIFVKNDWADERLHREMGFVLDKLGMSQEAADFREEMKSKGFADAPVGEPDEDEDFPREIRPLYKSAPQYPYNAALKGIEGYVIVEFTVKRGGETEGCEVIEATPEGVFEASACEAVSGFQYYPVAEGEADVDVQDVKHKITFELEK